MLAGIYIYDDGARTKCFHYPDTSVLEIHDVMCLHIQSAAGAVVRSHKVVPAGARHRKLFIPKCGLSLSMLLVRSSSPRERTSFPGAAVPHVL